ncbi:hypothetical protein OAP83_02515, partial [Rickettsiales bacterium]|nr:hypothetical protein [Rickettsiales bacterium]
KYAQKIFQAVDSKYQEYIVNPTQYHKASQQAQEREEKERLSKPIIENLITPILKIVAPRLENPMIRIGIGMSGNTNLYINPPLTNDEQYQLINLLNSVIKSFEASKAVLSMGVQRSMFSNTFPRSHQDPFLQTHINEQTKIKIEDFTTLQVLSGYENQSHINAQAQKITKLIKIKEAVEFILNQNPKLKFSCTIQEENSDKLSIHLDYYKSESPAREGSDAYLNSVLTNFEEGINGSYLINISDLAADDLDEATLTTKIIQTKIKDEHQAKLIQDLESKLQFIHLVKDDLPKLRKAVFASDLKQLISISKKFSDAGVKINDVAPDLLFYAVGSVIVLYPHENNGSTMEIINYLIDEVGIDPNYRVEQSGRGTTDILTEAAKYARPELLEGLIVKIQPTEERLAETSFNDLNILEHCLRKVKLPFQFGADLMLDGRSSKFYGIEEYESQWRKLNFLAKQGLVADEKFLKGRIEGLKLEDIYEKPDPFYVKDLNRRYQLLSHRIDFNKEIKLKTEQGQDLPIFESLEDKATKFVQDFNTITGELNRLYEEKSFGTFITTLYKLKKDFDQVSSFLKDGQVKHAKETIDSLYTNAVPLSTTEIDISQISSEKLAETDLLTEILYRATYTTPDPFVREKIKTTISNLAQIETLKPLLQMMAINSLKPESPLIIEAGDFPLKREADKQVLGCFVADQNRIILDVKESLQPSTLHSVPLTPEILQGFLAHEMHHAAEYYLHQNGCQPYPAGDTPSEEHQNIVQEISDYLSKPENTYFAPNFNSEHAFFLLPACYNINPYQEDHKLPESVVRPSHALAAIVGTGKTEADALTIIEKDFPVSTEYFREEMQQFLEYNQRSLAEITKSEEPNLAAEAQTTHIAQQQEIPKARSQYQRADSHAAEDEPVIYKINSKDTELQNKSAIRIDESSMEKTWTATIQDQSIFKKIVQNISEAKEVIIDPTGSSPNITTLNQFVMHVIEFAQTYDGVGNAKPRAGITEENGLSSQELWTNFCTQQGLEASDLDGLYSFKNATGFSRQYQNVAKESGIYTGREANLRTDKNLQDLGARLKRIPEDMNQEIQEALNQARQL